MTKKENSTYLAECSVIFNGEVKVNGIKLLNGKKGRYILMPENKREKSFDSVDENQKRKVSGDIFHPIQKDYSDYLVETVLKGYDFYLESGETVYEPPIEE